MNVFVIYEPGEYESDGRVRAVTTSQVVASMASQRGWMVYSNLPAFATTSEFIAWADKNPSPTEQYLARYAND